MYLLLYIIKTKNAIYINNNNNLFECSLVKICFFLNIKKKQQQQQRYTEIMIEI